MENEKVYRHELKYMMNRRDMDGCMSRLLEFAHPDEHAPSGCYFVRSLYFDDPAHSSYEEKESGVSSRSKYRIRIYNLDDGYISLEKKIKEGAYIRKESAALTRSEYDMIMNGRTDFLLKRPETAAREFAADCRLRLLAPEVIVDYDRVPLVYDAGSVRITFDMNIRAVFDGYDFFCDNAPAYAVMGQDMLIMEVKYTEFLPDIFHNILPDEGSRIAASKYVMCVDAKRMIKEGY